MATHPTTLEQLLREGDLPAPDHGPHPKGRKEGGPAPWRGLRPARVGLEGRPAHTAPEGKAAVFSHAEVTETSATASIRKALYVVRVAPYGIASSQISAVQWNRTTALRCLRYWSAGSKGILWLGEPANIASLGRNQ